MPRAESPGVGEEAEARPGARIVACAAKVGSEGVAGGGDLGGRTAQRMSRHQMRRGLAERTGLHVLSAPSVLIVRNVLLPLEDLQFRDAHSLITTVLEG